MPTTRELTYIDRDHTIREHFIGKNDACVCVSFRLRNGAENLGFGHRFDMATPMPNVDGWMMQPPMVGGVSGQRFLRFSFEKRRGRKVPPHVLFFEAAHLLLQPVDAWLAELTIKENSEREEQRAAAALRVYDSVKKQAVSEAYYTAEAYAKAAIDYDTRLEALKAELKDETLRQVAFRSEILSDAIEGTRHYVMRRAVSDFPSFSVGVSGAASRAIDDAITAVKTGAVNGCILPRLRL